MSQVFYFKALFKDNSVYSQYECGHNVVVKLRILGSTFSLTRLRLWSTSWCAPICCLRCSLEL